MDKNSILYCVLKGTPPNVSNEKKTTYRKCVRLNWMVYYSLASLASYVALDKSPILPDPLLVQDITCILLATGQYCR